ncbi:MULTISPECIES: hypothetical protein [Paenibacillus]|uniref:hypothetical protein n=1 Tax=Paenibacillus TaxID=44249 RepID=UPI0030DBF0E5
MDQKPGHEFGFPEASPNQDYHANDQSSNPKTKHSGPGIASFVIGITALLAYIVIFVLVTAAISSYMGHALTPEQVEQLALHPAIILASVSMLACIILNLAGLIVGIVGLVIRNRRKVFAVIGTLLNGLMILACAALVFAGIYLL